MRPCAHCLSFYIPYVLSVLSEKYEQCYRFNRPYDLAVSQAEVDRLLKQSEELEDKVLKTEVKALESKTRA